MTDTPRLIVVTGVMAAGKSSVAQRLAERLPKSVHLRGDAFRRMIVGCRAEMTSAASSAALDQLRLRYRVAAAAARVYLDAGFTVVHQDVMIGPALADALAEHQPRPVHLVVLCPRPDVVAAREAGRSKVGYHGFSVAELDRVLRHETPRLGLWLDTSELDVDATVDRILPRLDDALVRYDRA